MSKHAFVESTQLLDSHYTHAHTYRHAHEYETYPHTFTSFYTIFAPLYRTSAYTNTHGKEMDTRLVYICCFSLTEKTGLVWSRAKERTQEETGLWSLKPKLKIVYGLDCELSCYNS
jgi:hypothetical protein